MRHLTRMLFYILKCLCQKISVGIFNSNIVNYTKEGIKIYYALLFVKLRSYKHDIKLEYTSHFSILMLFLRILTTILSVTYIFYSKKESHMAMLRLKQYKNIHTNITLDLQIIK